MNDMLVTRPGFDPLLTEPSLPSSAPGKTAGEFAAQSRPRELGSYGRAPESAYTGNVAPSSDDIQAFNAALFGESMPADTAEMLPDPALGNVGKDAPRGMDAKAPPVPAQPAAGQPGPAQPAAAQMTAAQPAPAQPAAVQAPAAQPAPVQIPAAQPAAAQSTPAAVTRADAQPLVASPLGQPKETPTGPDAKAPARPAAAQMTAAQPAPAQPAPSQAAAVQVPAAAQPASAQPVPAQPAPPQAAAVQIPAAAQAAPAQPAAAQPAPAQLPAAQPAPAQPAPAQPATDQPTPAKAPPARADVPPNAAAETLGKARLHPRSAESDREMPAFNAASSAGLTPALPVTGAENLLAQQSQIVANPVAAASSQAPVRDPLSAEHIVQYVTRTLARRDLEALSAGREVVLRLDDRLLPGTTLTFQPLTDDLPGSNSAQPPQVLISLRTESPEVNAFLTAHADDLVEAMSREAPGIRWELNDEFYRAPATSGAGERSAGLTNQDSESQAPNEPGSRGDRSSGQDQPRDNPQGQAETFEEDTLAYKTPRSVSALESVQGQGTVNFETLVDG